MNVTPEQQEILACREGSFRVLAAAGSGKTTTMALYVKQQIESHTVQENQICFITFTRFAAKQIRDKVAKILGRSAQLLYGTFHATMYKLGNKAGIIPPQQKGLYDACMEEGVKRFTLRARRQRFFF